jgi:hypothetical protein
MPEILENENKESQELPLDVGDDPADSTSEAAAKRSASLKDAWKQVENIGQVVGEALQTRSNVVMVRVNDEALRHLDMLVEAEVTKSRSESAAYLISEGIRANQELFGKISEITDKIETLRAQLRQTVKNHEDVE